MGVVIRGRDHFVMIFVTSCDFILHKNCVFVLRMEVIVRYCSLYAVISRQNLIGYNPTRPPCTENINLHIFSHICIFYVFAYLHKLGIFAVSARTRSDTASRQKTELDWLHPVH